MKRFDCELTCNGFGNYRAEMQEDEMGDWVRWEDAKTLEAKISRMEADVGYPTYEDMRTRDARIVTLEDRIKEAMELMRESGADQREYVVFSVLSAAINP